MKNTIFCIVGPSSAGKDTFYTAVLNHPRRDIVPEPVIPYTTRPMRDGEVNGREYYFVTAEQLNEMETNGQVIERRDYPVANGDVWTYFTPIFTLDHDRILITTPVGLQGLREKYGDEAIVTILLDTTDKTKIHRRINREDNQANPDYNEVCRRFLADKEDFRWLGNLPNLQLVNSDCPAEDYQWIWEKLIDVIQTQPRKELGMNSSPVPIELVVPRGQTSTEEYQPGLKRYRNMEKAISQYRHGSKHGEVHYMINADTVDMTFGGQTIVIGRLLRVNEDTATIRIHANTTLPDNADVLTLGDTHKVVFDCSYTGFGRRGSMVVNKILRCVLVPNETAVII